MASEESKKFVAEIRAKIEANNALLAGCPGRHNFRRVECRLFSKWRCTVCGGETDATGAHWYVLGLDHAKRR